jgi:DNA-directed RNA polymerase I and III subunit RPAC2
MSNAVEQSPVSKFPRDAHVLYQEHTKRLSDGDAVDISNLRKVEILLQYIEAGRSAAKLNFLYEDHTLGNALRHVLMQNPKVITAGYSVPHPLEPKMMMQVQCTEFAPDVVAEGLAELEGLCAQMRANFEAATQTATNK